VADKDTQKFSRESFKDKILRELDEAKMAVNAEIHDIDEKAKFLSDSVGPITDAQQAKLDAIKTDTDGDEKTRLSRDSRETGTSKPKKMKQNRPEKKKTKSVARWITTIVVLLLLAGIGGGGYYGYHYVVDALKPVSSKQVETKPINIPAGSTSKSIGALLQKAGIVKDGRVFQYYTKFESFSNFKSGYHNLSASMTLEEIAKELQKTGTEKPVEPTLGKVTIPEGYTLEQFASAIELNSATEQADDKTPFTKDAFLALVTNQTFIDQMKAKYPVLLGSLGDPSQVKYQLEGYLFPATYEYTKKTTLEGLVEEMLIAMDSNLKPYYDTITTRGMSVNEFLSLASYVEKEGNNDEDRRKIAEVFYNRLNVGMPLQSNISILYAMGKVGESTTLEEDATIDTNMDTPYNLYIHTGYGPGPVDSPSASAIKATAEPDQNNYYYFVADVTTGKVYYSETYEEHEQNVAQYVNANR
jgi:UPF0755 protein